MIQFIQQIYSEKNKEDKFEEDDNFNEEELENKNLNELLEEIKRLLNNYEEDTTNMNKEGLCLPYFEDLKFKNSGFGFAPEMDSVSRVHDCPQPVEKFGF